MKVHICNFTTVENIQRGRYRFDFSEMFGPLFIRASGEPLKNQPQPGSRAWVAFEDWHREYRAAQGKTEVEK
jgi:hypothetical protein